MSKWLYQNVGYSIQKVAYRGKNAGYVKAIKGEHNLTEKRFEIKDNLDGFVLC